ncbi:hypothetical protein TRIP_B40271 [uncultured Desulfatiglans sp.]|nr:hypothetical protein TRIP_B40271 [uncultured Desulfatiglans sp.]
MPEWGLTDCGTWYSRRLRRSCGALYACTKKQVDTDFLIVFEFAGYSSWHLGSRTNLPEYLMRIQREEVFCSQPDMGSEHIDFYEEE